MKNIKDMINIDIVDETPQVLEPITTTTLEKIGATTVIIHTFSYSIHIISCLRFIFSNGLKGAPTLLFKGVKDGKLEKRLNKYPELIKGKVNIKCQINSLVDV